MRTITLGALVAALLLAGACSNDRASDESVGDCKFGPGAVCRDQDLQNVSFVAADLRGADFSGSNLSQADLRDADLTDAKLVGSILAGTNFAGANLTNVDMTNAFLFGTNLTAAEVQGVRATGAQRCQVTEPDGSFTSGAVLSPEGEEVACSDTGDITTTTTAAPTTGPPRVEYFRLVKPERCITDVRGDGVDVEWSIPNAGSMVFYVDGIRIESATKQRGTKRLPFRCDGGVHIVSVQAFGDGPSTTSLFTASLEPTAPLSSRD